VIQEFELRVLGTKILNPASETSYTVSHERRRFALKSCCRVGALPQRCAHRQFANTQGKSKTRLHPIASVIGDETQYIFKLSAGPVSRSLVLESAARPSCTVTVSLMRGRRAQHRQQHAAPPGNHGPRTMPGALWQTCAAKGGTEPHNVRKIDVCGLNLLRARGPEYAICRANKGACSI
jgi:hypothetical protein